MKSKGAAVVLVLAVGTGFLAWCTSARALAGSEGAVAAQSAATEQAEEVKPQYVGSKTCKKCHVALYKSWEKTANAKALDVLKPGEAKEAKEKHGLDVNKDYTKDEKCLKCHVTGFGQEGGYAIPDPEDKKAVKKAKALAGVGCEACHGPGSEYNKVFKDIMKSKRKYKVEELYKVGLKKVDESTCTACHNDQSATHDPEKKFDFEEAKKTGTHDHEPLKQREG